MAIRCRTCVAHEVDSQYCQHCLEYIPTIDPKFQMNKCASCYQCPRCLFLLSITVLSVSPPAKNSQDESSSEPVKRTCQLSCKFCRWSSDVFVTEDTRGINSSADVQNPNLPHIEKLISFYESVSQKEKADKKRRRHHTPGTMDLLKKYGIYNTLSPKLFESLRPKSILNDAGNSKSKDGQDAKRELEPDIDSFPSPLGRTHDEIDKLDENFHYSKEFNVDDISSLGQRMAQIEIQPEKVSKFKPISKSLSVKHSLRCKECERNLCRSEYSPISIRFKIQSAAYYHIPEIKLKSDRYPIKLQVERDNIVEFTLQNQTLASIKVKLDNTEKADLYNLRLPPADLVLSPKDDTVDCEHIPFNMRPLNEETQVTFQSPSKIGFYAVVVPKVKVDLLEIKFSVTHDVLVLQSPKDPGKVEKITHIIKARLGPVEDSK